MKFSFILLLFSLFVAPHAYSKSSFQLEKLSKCMNAMGYGASGIEKSYVAMATTDNQILVFTNQGAKLVQSGGKEANMPFFVFKVPGESHLSKTYVEKMVAWESPGLRSKEKPGRGVLSLFLSTMLLLPQVFLPKAISNNREGHLNT